MAPHTFSLSIALDYAGEPIGNVLIKYTAQLYASGELRCVNIIEAIYKESDIAPYVCAAQRETWSEWELAAEDHYKDTVYEAAPIEHD